MITDAGPRAGLDVLKRMEQIRQVFQARTKVGTISPLPVRIFAFASEAGFRDFRVTENSVGYFQSGADRDYIAMLVTGKDLYRVVIHEYVHLLLHHAKAPVPAWFAEGTAELYSTIHLTGREVRVGEVIPAHLATLRADRMMALPVLFTVDHSSSWYNEREKSNLFYAQSWALAHMLNFSPEYQPGFRKFLDLLFAGEELSRCLQEAYGKSPHAVMTDLDAYVRRDHFDGLRFPAPKPAGAAKSEPEAMSPRDSRLALADLLLALRRTDRAESLLAAVAAKYPDDPLVVAALAEVALQKNDDVRARDLYRRAIALGHPGARLRYDYAMALRDLNAPDAEIEKALRDAVNLDRTLFDAQYLLGYTLLRGGRYGEAIPHLRAAANLQPARGDVWEHLALACHYGRRKSDAREAARRFRRAASSPEEIQRAEGMLKLVEEGDSVVQARRASPGTGDTLPASLSRITGRLQRVDCLGEKARLLVQASDGKRLFLLVSDPHKVVLRNAGAAWTEFTCGPLAGGGRKVSVDYRGRPDEYWGASGEVAAIEFH